MYLQLQTFAVVLVFTTFVHGQQNKRQVGQSAVINTDEDRDAAETGFGANIGGHGKYFQDIYSVQLAPQKIEFGHVCESPHDWEQRYERKDFAAKKHQDHYEFGHRKGNEHHFKERHEKAHPHAGEFKTKVRWGDKHGGYGEHYWDYNHAGHGDGDGEESQAVEEYESYEPSETNAKPIVKNSAALRDYTPRAKRHEHLNEDMKFVYDPASGVLMDEVTGKRFKLQLLN